MSAAGWRLAGRIARRETRRNRARSILIVAMLALPVIGLSAVDVVVRTSNLTPTEEAARALGTADLSATQVSDSAIEQSEDVYLTYASTGDVPADRRVDPSVLPAGSTSTEVVEGPLRLRTSAGVREVRALTADTGSPLITGLVRLLDGRLPRRADEVAVSPVLAESLGSSLGDQVELADGTTGYTVVGLAVRPDDARVDSVLGLPGALGMDEATQEARLLIDLPAGRDAVAAGSDLNALGIAVLPREWILDPAPQPVDPQARALTIGLTVVTVGLALVQVILLAGAAFAVGARRQRRALGLLAATGADGRDVGRTILAQGALLGLAAAAAGLTLGLLLAVPLRMAVERLTGTLYGGWQIRWFELVAVAALGLVSGLLSALLPARAAARQDPLRALMQRPDPPRSGRRLTASGLAMAAAGLGITLLGTRMEPANFYVILGGAVLVELGFVLCAPALVGLAGRLAGPLPVPLRMALRDASRNRARSGPAVGAVMAALAGCTAVSIFFVSQDADAQQTYQPQTALGQVTLTHYDGSGSVAGLSPALLGQVTTVLPGSGVATSQQVAPPCAERFCDVYVEFLAQVDAPSSISPAIGGPDFLRAALGRTDVAAERALGSGSVVLLDGGTLDDGDAIMRVSRFDEQGGQSTQEYPVPAISAAAQPGYSFALALMSPQTASQLGLVASGPPTYLFTPSGEVTSQQEERLTELSASGEVFTFSVERGYSSPAGAVLLALLGASVVVVLGATGISTALAAAEGRADLATLAAVGAAPRTRRLLAMSQAAVVALLGAALGALAGFVPAAALVSTLAGWPLTIPWWVIGTMLVVVPLLAAGFAGVFTRSRLPMVRRTA